MRNRVLLARRLSVWLALAPVLTACGLADPQASLPALTLHEATVYNLPDSFPVTRIDAAANGTVAVISAKWPYILLGKNGTYNEFGSGLLQRPIAVSLDSLGEVTSVVDAGLQAIIWFHKGQPINQYPLRPGLVFHTAGLPDETSWHVFGVDTVSDNAWLLTYGPMGLTSTKPLGKLFLGSAGLVSMASMGTDNVVIVHSPQPGKWIRVKPDDDVTVTEVFDTLDWQKNQPAVFLRPKWFGAGIVAMGDLVIYAVADLRSDERRLLLVRADGKVIRQSVVNGPMAIAAVTPDKRYLIAVRNINGQQIVFYRCEWHQKGSKQAVIAALEPFRRQNEIAGSVAARS